MILLNPLVIRLIVIHFFGIWVINTIYQSFRETVIFDAFIQLILFIVSATAFVFIILKDLKEYRLTKKKSNLLPSACGILFILMALGLIGYQYNRLNSPSLLKAYWSDGDWNGGTLDLKQNGNYVYSAGSGLGQDFFYGTYSIMDNVILLDQSTFDGFLTSKKLILKTVTDTLEQKITHKERLVMINAEGIENAFDYFWVSR
ncbi:MAG: hypothetical protein A3D31_07215 [Candidatus Fluviicola riflensis]|nr:MAG: hypothetical protein CHH17_07795 [Candidatus Fluviicola riflensis]OGS79740.1 MAG: hypothetical protein A3D31_07215 [Candidatus Fluviicola riflensis]OGS87173.1 MAG: hypothetical protein A2724_06675 [Fluviicola sp. RIFCSPHIGHO2_01_FULL_43_53]OGS89961.1 MAG: hypothetical protein A3E30_03420 [Fluviicola sp. RIFCSPHIGHO2_12_FULL_43_24]